MRRSTMEWDPDPTPEAGTDSLFILGKPLAALTAFSLEDKKKPRCFMSGAVQSGPTATQFDRLFTAELYSFF